MLFVKSKPVSVEGRVLAQLKKSQPYGSFNYELAKVGGLAWHRRVTDLRQDGHNIQAVRISKGVFKYYLNDEE